MTRNASGLTSAGDVALARVGGYLRGTTVLSALIALSDLVFMWLLGVPLAVPLAVIVFLAGYIPYFGGFVATLVILIVTVASVGAPSALVLLVLIGVRNVFLGYLVRPAIYGRTVRSTRRSSWSSFRRASSSQASSGCSPLCR